MPLMKPLEDMAYHTDPTNNSTNQTSTPDKEKILLSRLTRNLQQPQDPKLKIPSTQSYAGLDRETKKSIGDGPSVLHKQDHKNKQVDRRGTKESELVKYMSDLPCYLQRVERGENLQEKALNFGVLDWGRLEKWNNNQHQIPTNSLYPSSNINMSSPFSAAGSSALSSKNGNGTKSHLRKQPPPFHAHPFPSSKESYSQGVKSSRGNSTEFQDFARGPANYSVSENRLPKTHHTIGKNSSEIKLDKGKEKYSVPEIILDMGTSTAKSMHDEVSLSLKGKTKAKEFVSANRTEQYDEYRHPDQLSDGQEKTIVLLLPRDSIEKSTSRQFESKAIGDGRPTGTSRKSFSNNFRVEKEVHFAELYSDLPHSCPLPCRFESSELLDLNSNSWTDSQSAELQVNVSHSLPCSADIDTVSSRDKRVKENNITTKSSILRGPKAAEATAVKGWCPSPTHSTIGLGQMSRSYSSKEVSSLPKLHSNFVHAKSGPVDSDASCMDTSDREKASAKNRSRSSPLRRLLDPLLKSKTVGRLQSLPDESKLMHKAGQALSAQLDSSMENSVKNNQNTINSGDSCQDEKQEVKMVQALLKVIYKHGLPSFTFVVNDNSNILTATMKKISTSEKYDCSWIYTFYSFQKSKKKNGGWINQGSKSKSHDYVPKVVAEMKVSGSKFPHSSNSQFMSREFVLFGVEQRPPGTAVHDLQPNNELAAIIVKVPKETTGKSINDGRLSDEIGSTECLRGKKCSCNSEENAHSEPKVGSQTGSSTVVILPSGVHGLSATGVPSPLMDRWRSGGSCDCGGWDEGCNLRILANLDQCCKSLNSSTGFVSPVQFDLFDQGRIAQDKRPVFSLGTFTEGIFSVDFDASISSLQAFSLCAAVLHSRKLAELSEVSNLLEDKISQELMSSKNYRSKAPTGELEGDPPTYLPFPPHSPVGRV